MADCLYKIKIGDEWRSFNSEQELDGFLASQTEKWDTIKADPTFFDDPVKTTVETVKTISEKAKSSQVENSITNEDGEIVKYYNIPGSIGVTKLIQTKGFPSDANNPMIPPFDKKKYLDNKRSEYEQEGLDKREIERRIKNLEDQWKLLGEYGEDVHSIFESIINGVDYSPKYLSKEIAQDVKSYFYDWIDKLKERHGSNCQFLVEVPIISKEIHELYKNAGIDSVNGRIDLLVIDENGNAHIYDFKTSHKQVGSWDTSFSENGRWHTNKKKSAAYQTYIYGAILKQYGINVASTNVLPIFIDVDINEDNTLSDLRSVELDTDHEKTFVGTSREKSDIEKIFPVSNVWNKVDLTKSIIEPMSKFFPDYEVSVQVQRNTVTLEAYIKKETGIWSSINPTDKDADKGKYRVYNPHKKNKIVYCQTIEERNDAILERINSENDDRGREISDLFDNLEDAISGSVDFEDIDLGNPSKTDYVKRIFRKYVPNKNASAKERTNSWKLIKSPQLIAAGIFVFTKQGKAEIVSLTHSISNSRVKLAMGDTILGTTKKNRDIDENKVLSATHGNIDLMKVMSLINSNTDILNNLQVTNIRSFNIWMRSGVETYNEILIDNFRRLCEINNIQFNLNSNNFATTLQSTISIIQDAVGEEAFSKLGIGKLTTTVDNKVTQREVLLKAIEEIKSKRMPNSDGLRNAIYHNQFDFNDPLQLSYMLLIRALNKLNDYSVYIELDPAPWLSISKQGIFTGMNINAPQNSPSLNVRTLSRMISTADTQIRKNELKMDGKIRKAFKDFYDYNQRNRFVGGEVKYFDNIIQHDADGNIDKRFRLKDPNSNGLSKEEKKLIETLAYVFNYYRYKGDEEKIEFAKQNNDHYYDIPIMMASTTTLMHNNDFKTAAKTKYDESLNFFRLIPEQEQDLMQKRRHSEVYNRFDIGNDVREDMIEKHGVTFFETQLEDVVRTVIHEYETEKVMQEFIPRLQGVKLALQYQQFMFGNDATHLLEYIDKYITLNVYNQPIMDERMRPVYKILSAAKQVTSMTTLGFNWRSGIREMLQGVWSHISRASAEAYGKDQFTRAELAKAWNIIFKDAIKDVNVCTLCDALNVFYGMANADIHQVRDRLSQSKAGIKNFDSEDLYFFNTAPDRYHRLGILIAKMMHDACWEAHEMVDDELVYNFKKDGRFDVFNDSKADKNSKKYRDQQGLYIAMLEQFNKEGYNLKYGDDLPAAYTSRESTSVRSFAELCFGHYDKNTQMLAKHMFMGSMWLQFKTFLSAKLEQWILKPGTYDQGNWKEVRDENGNLFVRVITFNENDVPSVEIKLESELKEGEMWTPLKDWQGRFMEGIAWTLFDFGKALYKLDHKELKELWANDMKRANLKLALWDMVWAQIMMWIVATMFLSGDSEDYTPISHGLASALYNSFSDMPITDVVISMTSDASPPSFSAMKNIFNQTGDVLSGDKGLFDATINSFGALRELRYVGSQL